MLSCGSRWMPIKPDGFRVVAYELHKGQKATAGEPCDRTIAGRAYYAAYLATRETVRTAYKDPRFDVRHSELYTALKNDPNPDISDVGTRLETLFTLRSRADYRLERTISRLEAGLSVTEADTILAALPKIVSKIPSGIPRK